MLLQICDQLAFFFHVMARRSVRFLGNGNHKILILHDGHCPSWRHRCAGAQYKGETMRLWVKALAVHIPNMTRIVELLGYSPSCFLDGWFP